MPIKSANGKDSFKSWVDDTMANKKVAVLTMMEDVGNGCVEVMRDSGRTRYTDRTNNLRSSTGYVVVDGGRIVETSGFRPEGHGTEGDGSKGSSEGKAYADDASATIGKNEMALVLVAGMNYAGYVEAKGLDVMASAKLQAKKEVKDGLDYLFKNSK